MKKLICVMALVCIGILLVSCGSNRLGDPKAQLMRDFGLHIDKKDCVLEELFNNYEGFPYEGIIRGRREHRKWAGGWRAKRKARCVTFILSRYKTAGGTQYV